MHRGLLKPDCRPLATASVAHWDDLLMHGAFDHHADPSHFSINALTSSQHAAYTQLADSYFAAGYEFFMPTALRTEDLEWLAARHGQR